MEKHQTYFNLLDALKEKGCPVCFLVQKTLHKSMDDFLYERINDGGVRREIRESLGFCNTHAWQLQKFGDGFGLSIIYEELLGILEYRLGRLSEGREGRNSLSAPLKELLGNKKKLGLHQRSKLTCPICKKLIDCEKRYVVSFIKYFDDPEFNISFVSSFGLCLPHLILSLKLCENKDIIRKLLKIELKKLKSLKQELSEFKRKHNFQFSKESFGKEKDSWIRVIEKLIGKEGIY